MWGGNHQCLSFYRYDIVCSLEANCFRKMGLSSFSILPQRNHRTKLKLFLEFSGQSINSQVSNSESPPEQIHHGLSKANPHHSVDTVLRGLLCAANVTVPADLLWLIWTDQGQYSLLNACISLHSLNWGLQELDILLFSCFPVDSGSWIIWKVE